eukprot:1792264-Prorocentrum_lima.AAC.1
MSLRTRLLCDLFHRRLQMASALRRPLWEFRVDPKRNEVRDTLPYRLCPVSYTHLTLPTICSV